MKVGTTGVPILIFTPFSQKFEGQRWKDPMNVAVTRRRPRRENFGGTKGTIVPYHRIVSYHVLCMISLFPAYNQSLKLDITSKQFFIVELGTSDLAFSTANTVTLPLPNIHS